eukprot:TRINITY_DN23462_c0_g1_i1.p1 TRINITY_DN23462_c0_g1~~TRINITY_DN23462_c0_g1_i1.p1  ORF type:complete len:162 (-),score=4.44 TRINITY_DN23462_c0_g1_i1:29-514(-)
MSIQTSTKIKIGRVVPFVGKQQLIQWITSCVKIPYQRNTLRLQRFHRGNSQRLLIIRESQVSDNRLAGTIPVGLSLMDAFSDKYLSSGDEVYPNKFFINNNNFTGTIPNFILAAQFLYDHLIVDWSGNQLEYSDDLFEGLGIFESSCLIIIFNVQVKSKQE